MAVCVLQERWLSIFSLRHKRCTRSAIGHSFPIFFQLTFLHPPVRATVGEVRYSIEIDVGGE